MSAAAQDTVSALDATTFRRRDLQLKSNCDFVLAFKLWIVMQASHRLIHTRIAESVTTYACTAPLLSGTTNLSDALVSGDGAVCKHCGKPSHPGAESPLSR